MENPFLLCSEGITPSAFWLSLSVLGSGLLCLGRQSCAPLPCVWLWISFYLGYPASHLLNILKLRFGLFQLPGKLSTIFFSNTALHHPCPLLPEPNYTYVRLHYLLRVSCLPLRSPYFYLCASLSFSFFWSIMMWITLTDFPIFHSEINLIWLLCNILFMFLHGLYLLKFMGDMRVQQIHLVVFLYYNVFA